MANKKCSKCGETKPLSEFHQRKNSKDGHQGWCKSCAITNSVAYHKANPERKIAYDKTTSLRKYGLKPVDYALILGSQGNVCLICGRSPGNIRFAVDHNHETGEVRGILCSSCNTALGFMKDNPDLLRRAADYLDFFNGKGVTLL